MPGLIILLMLACLAASIYQVQQLLLHNIGVNTTSPITTISQLMVTGMPNSLVQHTLLASPACQIAWSSIHCWQAQHAK